MNDLLNRVYGSSLKQTELVNTKNDYELYRLEDLYGHVIYEVIDVRCNEVLNNDEFNLVIEDLLEL